MLLKPLPADPIWNHRKSQDATSVLTWIAVIIKTLGNGSGAKLLCVWHLDSEDEDDAFLRDPRN